MSPLILTTRYFAIPGPERLSGPDSHTCGLRASQAWLTRCLQPHLVLPVRPRRGEGGLNGTLKEERGTGNPLLCLHSRRTKSGWPSGAHTVGVVQ